MPNFGHDADWTDCNWSALLFLKNCVMSDTNGFFTKARIFNVEVPYYTFVAHTAYCYYLYITIYKNKKILILQWANKSPSQG